MKHKAATVDDILGTYNRPITEKLYGIMIYDHKTAGSLMMVPKSQFKATKKMMDRTGQQ